MGTYSYSIRRTTFQDRRSLVPRIRHFDFAWIFRKTFFRWRVIFLRFLNGNPHAYIITTRPHDSKLQFVFVSLDDNLGACCSWRNRPCLPRTFVTVIFVWLWWKNTTQCIIFRTCYRGYWTVERPRQQPNYHAVRRSCRERGALFEDPDFPAGPKCLYKNKRPAIQPIVWMRPHVSIYHYQYTVFFIFIGFTSHLDSWPPKLFPSAALWYTSVSNYSCSLRTSSFHLLPGLPLGLFPIVIDPSMVIQHASISVLCNGLSLRIVIN